MARRRIKNTGFFRGIHRGANTHTVKRVEEVRSHGMVVETQLVTHCGLYFQALDACPGPANCRACARSTAS